MSSEIIQMVLTGLVTFLTTGGLSGILYYNLHKQLKQAEIKSAELENISSTNSEWIKICEERSKERERLVEEIHETEKTILELRTKITELNKTKERAWEEVSNAKIQCAKKDRIISELNWYRCEVNGCPYRKPPRKYGAFDFPKNAVVNTEETNENIK